MTDPVILGRDEMIEQPARMEYERGQGWKLIRTWIGPPSRVDAKAQEILGYVPPPNALRIERGVPSVITTEFPLGKLGMDPPENSDVEEIVWELTGEEQDSDIRTHGYFNLSGISPGLIEAADDAIRRGIARKTDWNSGIYSGFHIDYYVACRLRGIESYRQFTYRLTRTLRTGSASAIKEDFTGHQPGKIIKWDEIGVPVTSKFQRPKLHVYDPQSQAWTDKDIDEWLTCAPTVRWDRRTRRWELARSWIGAEKWAKYIYDGGSWDVRNE